MAEKSNIANEHGHTFYPKIVYPTGAGKVDGSSSLDPTAGIHSGGVVVNNEAEEKEAMKDAPKEAKTDKPKATGWDATKLPPTR